MDLHYWQSWLHVPDADVFAWHALCTLVHVETCSSMRMAPSVFHSYFPHPLTLSCTFSLALFIQYVDHDGRQSGGDS
jgi:hypothetical protein